MKITAHRHVAGFTLVEIMIVVAIIGLLATMAIPNLVRARMKAQQNTCISNLHQIEGAKQMWALECRASPGTVPTADNIQAYLGKGTKGTLPSCPADPARSFATSYTLNDLATSPACLIFPGTPRDPTGHYIE